MHQLEHIFHLIEQKYHYSLSKDPTRATHIPYQKAISYFVDSLDEQIRANNEVGLESDLSDILRDFCNLVYVLEKEGYIESVENIFKRCLDTYEERLMGHREDRIDREETRRLQRSRLFYEQAIKNQQD